MDEDVLKGLKRLTTPEKIQDFLDTLPFNHEKRGETCMSPATVLRTRKAHCLEGALLAAAALSLNGEPPILMNLKTGPGDIDHAVTLFKRDGLWGAISKTNHAVLRYRDPIYPTLHALALSYFPEYYLYKSGRKTLRAFSKPFNLRRFGKAWMTLEKPLWHIAYALADAPHTPIAPKKALKRLRKTSSFERKTTGVPEWKPSGKRRRA